MDNINHEERLYVAETAITTLQKLNRTDLIPCLFIEWSKRFTSRMGDALYLWSDAEGPDYPRGAHRMLENPRYHNVLTMSDTILRAVRIRFSIPLWHRATKKERHETVVHETCHLIACHEAMLAGKFEIKDHGIEWQATMLRAGVNPDSHHMVDTSGLGRRCIPCFCGCGDHWMTPLKAGQLMTKQSTFSCRGCGEQILIDGNRITSAQIEKCRKAASKTRKTRRRRIDVIRVVAAGGRLSNPR